MNKKSSYNREELLACARGELFGPGNAQLPLPNMLMVDRIVHIGSEGGQHGKGELSRNRIFTLICGFSAATSSAIR